MRNKQRRQWLIRILAIALGLSPFFALEAGLRLFGWSASSHNQDPFLDLHLLEPLFELDASTGVYQIPQKRLRLFQPAEFKAAKPSGTFRIFCLGGSTTQGEPYKTETAFPKWLELELQARAPQEKWEVVNCGGLSYASYRVLAILREVLQYEADLIVVYSGQNEFLEDRQYGNWRNVTAHWSTWASFAYRFKTVQLSKTLIDRLTDHPKTSPRTDPIAPDNADETKTEVPSEVDALLDYEGGLASYRRDRDWAEPVKRHFEWNLRSMVDACREARVPIVLCRPVVNLKDCPPLKFELDPEAPADSQATVAGLWKEAQNQQNDPLHTMKTLQTLLKIDPKHAGAWFFLGQLHFADQNWEQAHTAFTNAKDYDVCPLRATSDLQNIVSQVALETDTPLVDAEKLFSDRSPHGIVGDRWLVDHVHPNLEGHQILAQAIAEAMEASGSLRSQEGWEPRRTAAYRSHLSSLGEDYFLRGKQRLEGLRLWAQGRASKVRSRTDHLE